MICCASFTQSRKEALLSSLTEISAARLASQRSQQPFWIRSQRNCGSGAGQARRGFVLEIEKSGMPNPFGARAALRRVVCHPLARLALSGARPGA